MGKVFKYIGWAFLGILVFVAGTIGVLFAMGTFKDENVYLETINFDSDSIFDNLDQNDTTISKINDVIVANDNFNMKITFTPETATTKNLSLSVLKGQDVVNVPKTVVAGEEFTVEVIKTKQVTVGSLTYYIIDNTLYDSNYAEVTSLNYEIFDEIGVIKIGENYFKIKEFNVGGEVRIKAVDSEGGTTWSQFEFFVDSEINNINLDFSAVPGELENNILVFNENDLTFTLTTTPTYAINPSTGEIYSDKFSFKTITTESSNENVIKITKTENLEKRDSAGNLLRNVRYTFKTLQAGTSVITSKTLPTYQMYLDYVEADTIFKTDVSQGFMAVTNFANKYLDYLKHCGEIVVDLETGEVSTEGNNWYKEKSTADGRLVINREADYYTLMDLMFIKASQEIIVENVELTDFRLSNTMLPLNLFDTLKYNGQELTRENLTQLFGIKLTSTSSNISESALNIRLNDLKLYSIKNGDIFENVSDISGEDLFTVKELDNGVLVDKILYTPISVEGVTKYLTYRANDTVLKVVNPESTDQIKKWTITANKEQERDDDGTSILFILYDEISGIYFKQIANINIKINQINVFSLNQNLITDMSINSVNNNGLPNVQYVDLSLKNIGTNASLIKEFTTDASYNNIKLFVSESSAKINGYLKIRVKTKDGTLNGEPMVYTLPYNGSTINVYEINYKNDSSGRICIEALNTSVVYSMDDANPTNPIDVYNLSDIELFVAVVRTNVNGEPVDAEGNYVDEKYDEDGDGNWEYQNIYDIIKVAGETIKFNIYSYIQDLQFYTANEETNGSLSNFVNRTTVDGVIKTPVKMIVGQRFEMYVTNLMLNESGAFSGNDNERTNLNTALFDFWFNNLSGQYKNATFSTSNENAVKVHETLEMVNGMIKITLECEDATTSADVYVAVNDVGSSFLEGCRANIQVSFATIEKDSDTGNNVVYGYYSAGASTNQQLLNDQTLQIKGTLNNGSLVWQYYQSGISQGEFNFGGTDRNSLDYGLYLNLDASYSNKVDSINENIKNDATYEWESSNTSYVTITEKAGALGYDPSINILKGTPEGINIVITCTVYLYEGAITSSDVKYNGTKFTFRFVLNIVQSDVVITGYSINSNSEWQINDSTQTSQIINGGSYFDILAEQEAVNSTPSKRQPLTATIDGVDIRNSLIFTIETYHSADSQNSDKNAIYFLGADNKPTYQISNLIASNGNYSLKVYAKDSLTNIDAAIRISTFNSESTDYTYYITVNANLNITTSLPEGKNYIETTLGANGTVYTFGETGKTLNDYYSLKKGTSNLTLNYEVTSNSSYGSIVGSSFIPKRVAPTKNYETVGVTIKYNINVRGNTETYTYNTVSVRVMPYYSKIGFNTTTFNIKSGLTYNLFTDIDYTTIDGDNVKLFDIASNYSAEVDNLNDILIIQIADTEPESKLRTIFGEEGYNILVNNNNNLRLNNGEITTSSALTTDETIRIKVYFVEYDAKQVEITNTAENLIYLKVNKTVNYSTTYNSKDNSYEVNKVYSLTPNIDGSNKYIEVAYSESITNVYDSTATNNLVTLIGGDNVDIFGRIIKSVALQKYSNGSYSIYTGNAVSLIKSYETINDVDLYHLVKINYINSVNEEEYYKIVFISISNENYEFYFKLMPDITITTTYPVLESYENVSNNTTVDLEESFISKNRRVELSYNNCILNANVVEQDLANNTLKISVDKQKLIESGLVTGTDLLAFGSDTLVNFVLTNATKLFNYDVYSGNVNVDSGTLNESKITFSIQDYSIINTVVKITAFNGATTYYTFAVRNSLERYVVSVVGNANVFANNEFTLSDFINSCKLPSEGTSNYNALRILVQDFNDTTLKVKNTDGEFINLNTFELIPYNSVLKFNDLGQSAVVVFYMYTTTSVYGDNIVRLTLTINPNVVISANQNYIPAGVEIDIVNTTNSPLTITYGDADKTNIPTNKLSYSLVNEQGESFVYEGVTISGGKIKCENINENKEIYIKIDVDFGSCTYQEIRKITFVPNVRIAFDYENASTPTIYRTQVSAPISVNGGVASNRETLYLWDNNNNSPSYPICITDFYGANLDEAEASISFAVEEDESNIVFSLSSTTGALVYLPTNKANTIVKIKVTITWGIVSYSKIYNIAFQPNISSSNGVSVNYTSNVGSSSTTKQKLSIYGGSSVEFETFNTMGQTSEGTDKIILKQSYTDNSSGSEQNVTNSVYIDVKDSSGNNRVAYLLFEEAETDYYTITSSGISFKAVSETTEVRIPFYLNLRYIASADGIPYCGVFTDSIVDGKYVHEYYYTPSTNGEIVIELLSVISSVTSSYNKDNPYSVIVKNDNDNVADLYSLLNVTLVNTASFEDISKVLINREALAKLFSISATNNYATLSGKTVVFNIHNNLVSSFEIKFTIEGLSNDISVYATFTNNAQLSPVDAVKTFTYNSNQYYVIDNEVYDYNKNKVGVVDGSDVKINGSVVASYEELTELTLADGTKVLNIYNSDCGVIDLSTLVNYIVQNKFVLVSGTKYYIQSSLIGNPTLINDSGVEYSGTYEIQAQQVVISDEQLLDIQTEGTDKFVITNLGKYYIITETNGEVTVYSLYSNVNKENGVEYNGNYEVLIEQNQVKITSTNYLIEIEEVNLIKNGLTFIISSVGENDKYIQDGSNLTLLPFYSTNIGLDRTAFTFVVNSNNNLQTNITFYVLPVETTWDITYNGNAEFNVAEPVGEGNTIGETELNATYGTSSGLRAQDYTYRLQNAPSFAEVVLNETTSKYVLKIDYSKFSYNQEITLNVQATFNGNIVTNTYTITVEPKLKFVANNIVYTANPEEAEEQSILINGAGGLVTADGGTLTISLANSEDSNYVTINSAENKVVIGNSLYMLESKDIIFNVSYTNSINSSQCTFNYNSVLKLEQNTKLLNLFTQKEVVMENGASTVVNESAPIQIVKASDESHNYSNLSVDISVISSAVGPSEFSGLTVTASIDDGKITLTYGDVGGEYPTYVNAKVKLTVKNGATTIYESSEIDITLVR